MLKGSKNSVSRKLTLYTLMLSLFSLIFVGLTFIILDYQREKKNLEELLQLQANVLLEYQHEFGPLVQVLVKNSSIEEILITDQDNHTLFSYNSSSYQGHGLSVTQELFGNNGLERKVVIKANLEIIYDYIFYKFAIITLLAIFLLLVAWVILLKIQKDIMRPLEKILDSVDRITKSKDYLLRLPTMPLYELSKISAAFNKVFDELSNNEKSIKESESRLNLALWGSDEVMLDWDLENDDWFFDDGFESMLGYSIEEKPTCKSRYLSLVHVDDLIYVNEKFQQHISGKSPFFEVEHRLQHKQGHWTWILARAKVVNRTTRGKATRMVGTFVDITARKNADDKFKLFHKIFESTNEGVFVTDPKLKVIEINPAFSRITGFLRKEVLDKKLDSLLPLAPGQLKNEHYNQIMKIMQDKGYWQGEIWERRKNGEVYPQRLTMNKMQDENAQTLHYVGVFSDITKDKEAEDELAYLTHYDPLTSLPNRTLFLAQLEANISQAQSGGSGLALAIIGLDNFKIINDSLGHIVGDELLRSVSRRLLEISKNENSLARITGDEFSLIVTDLSTSEEIDSFFTEILNRMSSCFVIEGHDIFLTASIGVSVFPDCAQKSSDLLLQADTAMYHAKQSGGNCINLFTPEMNDKVQQRQRMESLLRSALMREEFYLVYQAKVDAKTGKIIGAEALIRWQNPEVGLVPPDKFIKLAEDIGAIIPIGKWVLRTACAQAKKWVNMGYKDFQVSVNLSAVQFKTQDFATEVARILWETKLEPEFLDLELTESLLMENAERCILMLKVLKSMGVTVSVDDFGTGYSSLSYLRRFPIDALKIDRSFVQNVLYNPEDASIIRAIVAMAKGLNLLTLAEGVEEKDQVDFLANEIGVEQFQGYYYSKPLCVEEFTKFLQDHESLNISQTR